jgi:hypothetical protein
MHRLTIAPLTAFLVSFIALGAQAQPTPATQTQAQSSESHRAVTSPDARASNATRHRIVLLHVDEVIAADTGEGIDERLLPMGLRLQSIFRYTTYRLVSSQVGRTECGSAAAFTLPGGWIVHVEPNAVSDNMIAMELMLFQGARPMMTTDLRLRNHGTLIVGGPRYQQGMLIIPIGADVPDLSAPPAAIPVEPGGKAPEMVPQGAGRPAPSDMGSSDNNVPNDLPVPIP